MEASKKSFVINNTNDHWAFLEHIEAPMWADLTLEANSAGEDISDDWFYISHPFHQWSSRQLKSKFSNPDGEILTSEVDSQGPASPELPSSVSRSRGKHYKSKKWAGINLNNLFDKQQGLRRRCFQAGSRFGQEVKPKSNVSRPKGLSSAKLGLAFERNARGSALYNGRKLMATCSNPMTSSSSVDNKTSESNSRSTITSENTQQQKKYMEVSSQPCVQKRGLSLIRSIGLRKSCVTKKASRLENGDDSMQPGVRKSSSGKSSVGSCSNPGYEVKFTSKKQREKITDGKDVVTMNLADKNRCKTASISQTSTIPVEGATSSNRKGSNINFAKPAYHRTAKSVVQYQTIRSRALLPGKVKENSSTGAKEKPGTRKVTGFTGKGKENAPRNVAVHQKCTERGVLAGGMFTNKRTTERNLLQKGDRAGSAALKLMGKDKDQCEANNRTNPARRIYLR